MSAPFMYSVAAYPSSQSWTACAARADDTTRSDMACAKAAITSLTRSAAVALAPEIRVNCVSPGVVEGKMWEAIEARFDELGVPETARYAERVRTLPLARGGSPAEIADVIVFLASPDSSYVHGQDIQVDGGQVMQ